MTYVCRCFEIELEDFSPLEIELNDSPTLDIDLNYTCGYLEVELEDFPALEVELEDSQILDIDFDISFGGTGDKYPSYEGPYTAIPKVSDQEFNTLKTSMEDNFKVQKITYLETPNLAGGLTVVIGEV